MTDHSGTPSASPRERDRLKRCPFCGGSAAIVKRKATYFVGCTDCTAAVEDYPGVVGREGEAVAVEEWNRRASVSVSEEGSATAEALAQCFHETYERLAPSFGYETRSESAKPWAEVPEANRRLMVAICAELLASRLREGSPS